MRAAPGRAWVVLGLLFVFQTLNFFDKLVLGLSAVPMMRELHLSPQRFGLIGSAFFLLFSLSGTLVGLFVIGRVRVKWVLLALALIWSASQIPMVLTGSLGVIVAARIVLGLGEGPGLPSALHACYDWFPPDRRGVPSAIVLQGISAGFLIGSPLLTTIIVRYGWRAGFAACGLLGVAWAIAWSLLAREGPYAAPASPSPDARSMNVPARVLWLDPTVVGIMLMSTASYYVVGMTPTWLPPYLELGLHHDVRATGWIISAVFAFQSPLLLFGSGLAQRLQRSGRSARVALGHACTLALVIPGCALIAAPLTRGIGQLVLIAIGFAAPSLTSVYGAVLLAAIAPPLQRGRLIVVIYSANACAGLVSVYGTGWLVGAAQGGREAGFAHAIVLAGAILLAGSVASFTMLFPDRSIVRFKQGKARSSVPPPSPPSSHLGSRWGWGPPTPGGVPNGNR